MVVKELKKNIKLFNNEPMISWPIKIALDSKLFNRVKTLSEKNNIVHNMVNISLIG